MNQQRQHEASIFVTVVLWMKRCSQPAHGIFLTSPHLFSFSFRLFFSCHRGFFCGQVLELFPFALLILINTTWQDRGWRCMLFVFYLERLIFGRAYLNHCIKSLQEEWFVFVRMLDENMAWSTSTSRRSRAWSGSSAWFRLVWMVIGLATARRRSAVVARHTWGCHRSNRWFGRESAAHGLFGSQHEIHFCLVAGYSGIRFLWPLPLDGISCFECIAARVGTPIHCLEIVVFHFSCSGAPPSASPPGCEATN